MKVKLWVQESHKLVSKNLRLQALYFGLIVIKRSRPAYSIGTVIKFK